MKNLSKYSKKIRGTKKEKIIIMNEIIAKRLWLVVLVFIAIFFTSYFFNAKPYAEKYATKIAEAKSLLTDDYSKEVFDGLIQYNIDKTPLKQELMDVFPENYCPNVPLKEGDVMINGGISSDLSLTFKVAETVGPNGEIIGFDPNNKIIEQINKEIDESGFKNIKTYAVGLWDKKCYKDLYIKDDVDASLIFRKNDGSYLPAQLVALDKFIVQENIKKIDFITLDVEGAEMEALKGAETILFTQKPNLAISIHHKPTDAFEIINYLNKFEYKFWLGYHSSTNKNEINVILYATAK